MSFSEIQTQVQKENQKNMEELFCYVLFSQKKDPKNPRGYSQRSVVLVSRLKLIKIFEVSQTKIK